MNNNFKYIILFIGLTLIIVSFVIKSKSNNAIEISKKGYTEFNKASINGKSYFYPDFIAKNENDRFIYVFKNNDINIVSLNDEIKKELDNYTFNGVTIRFVGQSKSFNEEVKTNILNNYNGELETDNEDYLKEEDFETIFGNYYLEVEEIINDKKLHIKYDDWFSALINIGFTLVIGFVCLFIIERRGFN